MDHFGSRKALVNATENLWFLRPLGTQKKTLEGRQATSKPIKFHERERKPEKVDTVATDRSAFPEFL